MKKEHGAVWYLFLLFGAIFLLSLSMVVHILAAGKAEQAAFAQLEAAQTEKATPAVQKETSLYDTLKAQNPDFWGWIAIAGTNLSYPVMHTPAEPEYYLHRNFVGEASQSGVPFLAGNCREGCGNAIIYGHNMKNGAMFTMLLAYADAQFWQAHPTIQLQTSSGAAEYEILAAFYARVYGQEESNVFRFYQYDDLTEKSAFDAYMEQVYQAALYDTGICAAYGDCLLTLVTCSYHAKDGRFVVVARKQNEGI